MINAHILSLADKFELQIKNAQTIAVPAQTLLDKLNIDLHGAYGQWASGIKANLSNKQYLAAEDYFKKLFASLASFKREHPNATIQDLITYSLQGRHDAQHDTVFVDKGSEGHSLSISNQFPFDLKTYAINFDYFRPLDEHNNAKTVYNRLVEGYGRNAIDTIAGYGPRDVASMISSLNMIYYFTPSSNQSDPRARSRSFAESIANMVSVLSNSYNSESNSSPQTRSQISRIANEWVSHMKDAIRYLA